jgi:hypothetical protein
MSIKKQRLTKEELRAKLQGEIFPMFQAEGERGAALLAAALLDDVLVEKLKEHLVPDPKAFKRFTDHSQPLGSFSSRIDMAYLLGLYGPKTRNTLHKIRDIRNAFAHYHQFAHFSDPQISQACLSLLPGYVEAIMEDPEHPTCKEPRRRFQACVGWLIQGFVVEPAIRRQPRIGFDYYHEDDDDDDYPVPPHIIQEDA